MRATPFFIAILAGIFLLAPFGCKEKTPDTKSEQAVEAGVEGEESGLRLGTGETYNATRNGVRMVLSYDSSDGMFVGTAENVTDATISAVRVEVHLSDGTELGPTEPGDLRPGEATSVFLSAEGRSFTWWKAHAESGEGGEEHSESGEHGGEH
jgi:hypothetical protein